MLANIITVTFNSEAFILDNIQSVNAQDYDNIRHIFIDGNSSDSTVDVIKKYSSRKSEIISESDDGIYDAINKGIRLCKEGVVFILNSDDQFISSDVVSKTMNMFRNDVSIVLNGIKFCSRLNTEKLVRSWEVDKVGSFKNGWHPPHPGFVCRVECYQKAELYNINLPIAADFELMFRFIELEQFKAACSGIPLVLMRDGGASGTIRGVFQTFLDVRKAFSVNHERYNFLRFYFNRYLPKIVGYVKNFSYRK